MPTPCPCRLVQGSQQPLGHHTLTGFRRLLHALHHGAPAHRWSTVSIATTPPRCAHHGTQHTLAAKPLFCTPLLWTQRCCKHVLAQHQAKPHEHNRRTQAPWVNPVHKRFHRRSLQRSPLLTTHGIAPPLGTLLNHTATLSRGVVMYRGGRSRTQLWPHQRMNKCGALAHSECPGGGLVLAVTATLLHMTHVANPAQRHAQTS